MRRVKVQFSKLLLCRPVRITVHTRFLSSTSTKSRITGKKWAAHGDKTAVRKVNVSLTSEFARKVHASHSIDDLNPLKEYSLNNPNALDPRDSIALIEKSGQIGHLSWAVDYFIDLSQKNPEILRLLPKMLAVCQNSRSKNNTSQLAKKVWDYALSAGFTPSYASYSLMIALCGRMGDIDTAMRIFCDFRSREDVWTETNTQSGRCRVCNENERRNCQIGQVWTAMVNAFKSARMFDECVELLSEMHENDHVNVEPGHYAISLISVLSATIDKFTFIPTRRVILQQQQQEQHQQSNYHHNNDEEQQQKKKSKEDEKESNDDDDYRYDEDPMMNDPALKKKSKILNAHRNIELAFQDYCEDRMSIYQQSLMFSEPGILLPEWQTRCTDEHFVLSSLMNGYAVTLDLRQSLGLFDWLISKDDDDSSTFTLRNGFAVPNELKHYLQLKTDPALVSSLLKGLGRVKDMNRALKWDAILTEEMGKGHQSSVGDVLFSVNDDDSSDDCDGGRHSSTLMSQLERIIAANNGCEMNQVLFGTLFNCCGGLDGKTHLKHALQYYQQMTEEYQIIPLPLTMHNFLHCAMNHFDRNCQNGNEEEELLKNGRKKRKTFVEWFLKECECFNIRPQNVSLNLLKNKGFTVKIDKQVESYSDYNNKKDDCVNDDHHQTSTNMKPKIRLTLEQ